MTQQTASKPQQAASLPLAILTPKQVEPRPHLVKLYPHPKPRTLKDQSLLLQLKPFLDGNPVVIDLETEGLEMAGTKGQSKKVTTVSLANHQAIASWNLLDAEGQLVWKQILEVLFSRRVPLVAHNLGFDLCWILRDLNLKEDGTLPQWYHEWRRPTLYADTYGLMRQLASEGFVGQQYSLAWAQKNLLMWEDTNKTERQRKLVEAGAVKRPPPKGILIKLLGSLEKAEEYIEQVIKRATPHNSEEEADEHKADA